jgi:hypothetical protein
MKSFPAAQTYVSHLVLLEIGVGLTCIQRYKPFKGVKYTTIAGKFQVRA